MISVIAYLTVKDGEQDAFEAAAEELINAVRNNEPGCQLYALHRTDDPTKYVFVERYTDWESVEAHRNYDHFKELGGKMGAHLAARPDV
ncbi:MAG: putative quinol monooxygenase, partial [Alphaproteobacteria bacterium]|nr:putative quinol monooxygenase [Alphaproteobacteria bacterium]